MLCETFVLNLIKIVLFIIKNVGIKYVRESGI